MGNKLKVSKRGFTLVELLIVIIIIAVLAAIAIPKFANSSTASKESALRAELKLLRNAVDLFKTDTGCYPAALADLAGTAAPANGKTSTGADCPITGSDFKGPYVSAINKPAVKPSDDYAYSTTAGSVGKVTAPSGTASDGSNYNTW